MKNFKKLTWSTLLIVGLLFQGANVSAQTVSVQDQLNAQLRALLIQLVEQLQDQLTELLEEEAKLEADDGQESDDSEDEDDYDPTESSSYPEQTSVVLDSSAKTQSVDGASNDYIDFELELSLRAFGNRSYVDQFASTAVEFEIVDSSDGSVVYASDGSVADGSVVISLSSSASIENDKYRIDEDESEVFTITSSFNPHGGVSPSGAGSYRFKLTGINYTIGDSSTVVTYLPGNNSQFRTPSANVIN